VLSSFFYCSKLLSLIYNFIYYNPNLSNKEHRKEKVNENPSADRFYHLSRLGNQVLMRPTDLDHIRIKRRTKRGRPFLIERSTHTAATWR
jgi:hypothetical protein